METITTEKILAIAPLLPVWVVVIIAAFMAYLVYSQVGKLKERLPGSRLPLLFAILRLAVYTGIVLVMLNPVTHRLSYLVIPPHVAVLIDGSASMSVDAGGRSRLDRVKEIISGEAWLKLASDMKGYAFDYYSFGSRLEKIERGGISKLEAVQEETNLTPALRELMGNYLNEPLAGIILFSDGRAEKKPDKWAPQQPLVAVGAATGAGFKDIRLSGLRAPDFAFLNEPVNIDLEVHLKGYGAKKLPVIIRKDGKIVKTRELIFKSGETAKKLSFTLIPETLGQREITIEVAPQADETIAENNRIEFVLPVERDKIRILMISGRPSWNYRFLRQALTNDGSIDLISFIILRSPTDAVNVPQSKLSLIPFPANALFTEELRSFDLIIFDNFSFRMNLPASYMDNIRNAVARGGSFLMIGGDESFFEGGFNDTPIEDILPVVLDRKRAGYMAGAFPFSLTPQGIKHPIMRIAGEGDPASVWASLPPLNGFNRTMGPKPDAVVLGISADGPGTNPHPILAVTKYGEGRSGAILTDGFWRWNFQAVGGEKSNRPYLMMVKQFIRWLVKDPSLDQMRLTGNLIQQGGQARINLRSTIYHDDFTPASDALLNVTAIYPSGKTEQLDYLPGDRPGEYSMMIDADEKGVYEFLVEARAGGELLGRSELKIEHTAIKSELQEAAPNEDLLRSIAESSGGRFFHAADFSSAADAIRSLFDREPERKLIDKKIYPLFQNLYMFLFLAGLPVLEWFLRRRRGLV